MGPVPLGDETDPMEEVPEKRVRGGVECDDELRGLSQEEFERICREVDTEMEFVTVYLARPLRTRTSVEVTSSAQELILRLKSESLYVSRVHSLIATGLGSYEFNLFGDGCLNAVCWLPTRRTSAPSRTDELKLL